MRHIPQQAIDFIRNVEGCLLHPYKDSTGKPTIGVGHLILPHENFDGGITLQEAEELLRNDMSSAVKSVCRLITRSLSDNQYSALLSFTFNEGGGTLQRSTLRKKCNRSEDDAMPTEFVKYCYAGGKKRLGLLRRRVAEAKLYILAD